MTPGDITAHGFPHDLDGHPLLAWMGVDWVGFVALELLAGFREQDRATDMLEIGATGPPELETRGRGERVASVTLRIGVQVRLRDGAGTERQVQGIATFTGPEPRSSAFDVLSPEALLSQVLREARVLVSRPGNDFAWSSWEDAADARRELDRFLAALRLGPVRTASLAGMFAPTGPMHELAVSSGWSEELGALADRFGAIEMVARDTWACRVCDADAGTIELRENGELRRTAFTSVLTRRVTEPGPFGEIWDAIAAGDARALFAADPELAPWWCPECALSYCGEHWARWDVFDDEEPAFHDSIRGRCPQGHERMLED